MADASTINDSLCSKQKRDCRTLRDEPYSPQHDLMQIIHARIASPKSEALWFSYITFTCKPHVHNSLRQHAPWFCRAHRVESCRELQALSVNVRIGSHETRWLVTATAAVLSLVRTKHYRSIARMSTTRTIDPGFVTFRYGVDVR